VVVLTLFVGAGFEEGVFRLVPIIFWSLFVDEIEIDWKLISVLILSSICFAFLHGSVKNVPIQGVTGVFFCFVFFTYLIDTSIEKKLQKV